MDIFSFHQLPLLLNQLCGSLSVPRCRCDRLLWSPALLLCVYQPSCLVHLLQSPQNTQRREHDREGSPTHNLFTLLIIMIDYDMNINNNTHNYNSFILYCVFHRLNNALQTRYIAEHKCIYKHHIQAYERTHRQDSGTES